jgi:hypothetical protein
MHLQMPIIELAHFLCTKSQRAPPQLHMFVVPQLLFSQMTAKVRNQAMTDAGN